jgi:diaminopimelate decarboxylase
VDLNLIGVSFHVGTGSYDTSTFAKAIADSAKIFALASNYNYELTLLDIGGGFPGCDSAQPSFEEFADTINISIKRHFSDKKNLEIVAEPGRYFAEGCLFVVTKIVSRKVWDCESLMKEAQEVQKILYSEQIDKNSEEVLEEAQEKLIKKSAKPKYFIKESTTLSFSNAIFEMFSYKPKLLEDHQDQEVFESDVYGNSGCKYELIASNVYLPLLNLNEFVYFENMGAYSISIANGMSYNGNKLSDKIFYC